MASQGKTRRLSVPSTPPPKHFRAKVSQHGQWADDALSDDDFDDDVNPFEKPRQHNQEAPQHQQRHPRGDAQTGTSSRQDHRWDDGWQQPARQQERPNQQRSGGNSSRQPPPPPEHREGGKGHKGGKRTSEGKARPSQEHRDSRPRDEDRGRQHRDRDADDAAPDVVDILRMHNILLLRHAEHVRTEQSESQILLDIENAELQAAISEAFQGWRSRIPSDPGPHPDGSPTDAMVRAMASYLRNGAPETIRLTFEALYNAPAAVSNFRFLARRNMARPPQGNWRMVMRMVHNSPAARQVSDALLALANERYSAEGFAMQRDRAPMDNLLRTMQQLRIQ